MDENGNDRRVRRLLVAFVAVFFGCSCEAPAQAPVHSANLAAGGKPLALPAPLPSTPTIDAGVTRTGSQTRNELSERAEHCLADATCPSAEAASLFVQADDAGERGVDCFRFLDGAGTLRDVKRARACLERGLAYEECEEGSSAGLELAELAVMRIDGVGGSQDVQGARALFSKCVDDMTKLAIVEHAEAKERDPKTLPMNFCKHGATTLTSNDCLARDRINEETKAELQSKALAAGLDAAGKELLASATKAYAAYVDAMGRYAYEVYIEGSIRNEIALRRERELDEKRTQDLAGFASFAASETSPMAVARAERATLAALAAVRPKTSEEKGLLGKTQDAWVAYRDAEVHLYEGVFGSQQGAGRVRAATLVRLEGRRRGECAHPTP
jgi:uncharacterized protein YecT (DUF1311 family)